MLRLLHTADVHLGARHTDLGERASLQRERQFGAFRAAVDLAIAEKVDLVLVAGDLFDSNTQPGRSVERVAAELSRLVRGSIRTVIIPGTHDVYDGASIYRAYDLAALAASDPDWVAVLTPDRSEVVFPTLDAVVYGRVFDTKRAPRSPLEGLDAAGDARATWHIGLVHGALAIPGRTDGDDVVFTADEVAATNLDYLALGHWHSLFEGSAGRVTYAYPGAPEPVALDQDGAGNVLLVTLEERAGERVVTLEARRVGRTRAERLELDVATVHSQPDLVNALVRRADPNLVLDVTLTGIFPDDLDLDVEEVERAVAGSFFRLRLRDRSIPALPDEPPPSADTVIGAFVRDIEARIAALEAGAEAGPERQGGVLEMTLELAAAEGEPGNGRSGVPGSAVAEGEPAADRDGAADDLAGELAAGAEADILEADLASPGAAEPRGTGATHVLAAAPESDAAAAIAEAMRPDDAPATPDEVAPDEAPATADEVGPVDDAAPATAAAAELALANEAAPAAGELESERRRAAEIAELREVLRLGRHLLEGRHVTL